MNNIKKCLLHIFIGVCVAVLMSVSLVWSFGPQKASAKEAVLFSAAAPEYMEAETTLVNYGGYVGASGETRKYPFQEVSGESANGADAAVAMPFHESSIVVSQYPLSFEESGITIDSVSSLTFRIYVHMTTDQSPFNQNHMEGVRFYPLGVDGTADIAENAPGSGVALPSDIVQNQWTDWVITDKAQIAALADGDGNFSGLQIMASLNVGSDEELYRGAESAFPNGTYIMIETVNCFVTEQPDGEVMTTADDDYTFGESTLQAIRGYQGGNGVEIYDVPIDVADDPTAQDGKVFDFKLHSFGVRLPENSIVFQEKIPANRIKSVTIRVFAHLSSSSPYSAASGGVRIFALGADGISEGQRDGYLVPTDIAQDQWVDLVLTGEYLAAIVDSEGFIGGIQLASSFNIDVDTNVYPGNYLQEGCAYLRIDSVTYEPLYDDIGDYSSYTGTYYSNDGMYILNEDNTAQFYRGEETASYDYYIFENGEILLVDGETQIRGSITAQTLTIGGNDFAKLGDGESVVFFDTNGGSNIAPSVVVNGQALQRPEDPYKSDSEFLGWTLNGEEYDFSIPVEGSFTLVAQWKELGDYLTRANDDYTFDETTLTAVNGHEQWSDVREFYDAKIVDDAGALDGKAFEFRFHSWGVLIINQSIEFNEPVAVSEVDGLIIRIYAHLSAADTYDTAYGGIRFYGLGANGAAGTGWLLPANIEQDQWIDLFLSKDGLQEFADADGMLSGLQIASGFLSEEETQTYKGTPDQGTGPWIRIDQIAVSTAKTLVYAYGSETREETVYTSRVYPYDMFVPEESGKVFAGWYADGELYDFNAKIYGDVNLSARWETAADPNNWAGLYRSDSGEISVFADGTVDFSDFVTDARSYGLAENGMLYVVYGNELLSFDLNDFQRVETVAVTYKTGEEDITVLTEKNTVITALNYSREGYIFEGWFEEGAETAFDFSTPISHDLTLVAKWSYDEAENAEEYFGSYYNKETGILIELLTDHKALFHEDGQQVEGRYYILKSDSVVFEKGDAVYEDAIFALRLIYDARSYTRLTEYVVTFEANGGSETAQQVINGGDYKVQRPADPTREGYVFKGWALVDGTAYDFDSVVTESISLYAQWDFAEPAEESNGESGGCSSAVIETSAAVAVLTIAATAGLLRKRRK